MLFASDVDGESEPEQAASSLVLTMSDEVQYRCAGFVQAEIERYAEDLSEAREAKDVANGDSSSLSSDSELESLPPAESGRGKKQKGINKPEGNGPAYLLNLYLKTSLPY